MDYSELILDLKKKKELKDLEDNFILERVKEYLKDKKIPDNKKSKEYKIIFKDLRRILRKVYGMFVQVREERSLKFYEMVFDRFKPKKVLDLGCGLEPLYYTKLIDAEFYSAEISEEIVKKINLFFKKEKIKGKSFIFDLVYEDLGKLPKVDLCLILKVLDSLEYFKRNISKELLTKIQTKSFVITFAKLTLSGKKEIKAKRTWLIRILKELNYKYEVIDFENEIVFFIEKFIY